MKYFLGIYCFEQTPIYLKGKSVFIFSESRKRQKLFLRLKNTLMQKVRDKHFTLRMNLS